MNQCWIPHHHPARPFTVVVKFIVGKLLNFTLVPGNPERALTLAPTTFSQLIMCGRVTPRAVRLPDTNHIHVNEHGGLGLFESLPGKQASQEIKCCFRVSPDCLDFSANLGMKKKNNFICIFSPINL